MAFPHELSDFRHQSRGECPIREGDGTGGNFEWGYAYYPNEAPRGGMQPVRRPGRGWQLPALHRDFCSPIGEWWTISLPLWCLAMFASWPLIRSWARLSEWKLLIKLRQQAEDPESRCRRARTVLRVSIVAMLAFGVVWWTSGWYCFEFANGSGRQYPIFSGKFEISTDLTMLWLYSGVPDFNFGLNSSFDMQWTVPHSASCAQSTIGQRTEFVVPLWFPTAICALIAANCCRVARAPQPGTCRGCGYDLRGCPGRICSECGAPVSMLQQS
jgi:hypothetical protein